MDYKWNCQGCGRQNKTNFKYCPHCGRRKPEIDQAYDVHITDGCGKLLGSITPFPGMTRPIHLAFPVSKNDILHVTVGRR